MGYGASHTFSNKRLHSYVYKQDGGKVMGHFVYFHIQNERNYALDNTATLMRYWEAK